MKFEGVTGVTQPKAPPGLSAGQAQYDKAIEAHCKGRTKMEKLLLRPEEVAEICSVGRSAVYAAIRDGRLESVKLGASRRIPRDAVARFVDSLREQA